MTLWKAISEGDFDGVLQAVRQADGWSEETLVACHNALIAWCERALASARSKDTCAALYDVIGRLRSAHGDAALDAVRAGTASEWRGFELLLDERVAKLAEAVSQRETAMQRRHVGGVVRLLGGLDALDLSALREQMRVSASTLSQVLSMMEAAQMVERERDDSDGRVRRVRLTAAEQSRLSEQARPVATAAVAAERSAVGPHARRATTAEAANLPAFASHRGLVVCFPDHLKETVAA